jgi:hypothetical protein
MRAMFPTNLTFILLTILRGAPQCAVFFSLLLLQPSLDEMSISPLRIFENPHRVFPVRGIMIHTCAYIKQHATFLVSHFNVHASIKATHAPSAYLNN